MSVINRKILLFTLIKHETLTVDDIGKEENLGIVPDQCKLKYLLNELTKNGFFTILNGVVPCTYTITEKGIKEGERLSKELNLFQSES